MAITIIYHKEEDGCWAESPDAPGFTAVAPTMDELERRVEEGLRFYFGSTQSTATSGTSATTKVEVHAGT